MNETTLNALINLFALFSAIGRSDKDDAVRAFSRYLRIHLGISSTDEYMLLFEELLDLYSTSGEGSPAIDKEQQARRVSENIRGRLQREECIMVFLRFLELARKGDYAKASGLFDTLSDVFEIPQAEYRRFCDFLFHTDSSTLSSADFIVIDGNDGAPNGEVKHIGVRGLSGELVFLYSPLIGHFIFMYRGDDELMLGENPIQADCFYAFREGSIIRGTKIPALYYTDLIALFGQEQHAEPFVFSAEEIEFRFRNSDNGLHTFSFYEKSGQMIAIMGGSGVGKSTLINILNGNIPVHKGHVRINRTDIQQDKKETEGLIGYVPQDDLLFEELTVRENLYYNACLCFDGHADDEIGERVDDMLRELELYALRDLKVGSPLKKTISGGQRKRLNIAMELIREPAILFVDEPTSGLSSTDSEMVMLLLKAQARKGKLMLVNIHQPSSAIYKLFDKLWVLDKGGRPIYTGNPLDAVIYFKQAANYVNADVSECVNCGNVNPEQVLDIIETKKIDGSGNFTAERIYPPQYWFDLYREYTAAERQRQKSVPEGLPTSEMKHPGLWKQFRIFFARNVRTKFADRQYLLVNLLEAPVLAFIVAYFTRFSEGAQYLFFENKNLIPYIFMAIVVVIFMGMSVSAEEIIKDRKILQREKFLNLSRFCYLNSKLLFLVLLSAFQTLAFVLIGNAIIGIDHLTFQYWIVLFSVAVCSNLIGLNISAALDSVVTIYILIPLLLIPQILLCGVIVRFDDLQNYNQKHDVVPVVGEAMVSRWAFEALAVEQYVNNPYMVNLFDIDQEIAHNRFRSDLLIPELTGLIDDALIGDDKAEAAKNLRIVREEMAELERDSMAAPYDFGNDTPLAAKEHLATLRKAYQSRYQSNRRYRDQIIEYLNRENYPDYVYDIKMRYHNSSLEKFVLNSDAGKTHRVNDHGVMQKIAPILKEPASQWGRAHFPSATKNLWGAQIDTLTFNVCVVWLMSLLLYIALCYDWLRKIIGLFSGFKK